MRGAVPCLSTDLPTHTVPHFIQALEMGRRTAPKARGAELAIAVMMTLCADRTMGCYERRRALPVYGSDNPRRATLYKGDERVIRDVRG